MAFSSTKSKEEFLEGSRHLNLVVVLEGLVQLVEDRHEAIVGLRSFLSDPLNLLPSNATEECHQIDGRLLLLLVYAALVEQDPLAPFLVAAGLVGEDRDVGVLDKVHAMHRI